MSRFQLFSESIEDIRGALAELDDSADASDVLALADSDERMRERMSLVSGKLVDLIEEARGDWEAKNEDPDESASDDDEAEA